MSVIIFDIDGPLFDAKIFLNNFFKKMFVDSRLSEEKVISIYEKSKGKNNNFDPEVFFDLIRSIYPTPEKVFWKKEIFESAVNPDASVTLSKLSKKHIVGIFSQGNVEFQKNKLNFINHSFDPKNIFIDKDKLSLLPRIKDQFSGLKIYIVDDTPEMINAIKFFDKSIKTIWLRRDGECSADITIDDITELVNIEL